MCVLCIHSTYDHTWVQERSICCNSFLFNTSWCLSYVPTSQRPYTSHQVFTPHTFDFPGSCQSYTSCVRPVFFHLMHDFLACYSHLSRCNSHLPCHRSFLRSSTEDARKPRKAHRRARPQEEAEEKGEKEPNVAANIAFLNCCIVFPSCCSLFNIRSTK